MASALDQVAVLLSSIGPLGTGVALAAAPVVAGAAVYITRMGSQAKIDRLEGELTQLESEKTKVVSGLEQKLSELESRYQVMLRDGTLIQAQLETIKDDLQEIAARVDAADCSILIPAPTVIPGDIPEHLVFLYASGPQSAKLRWVRVPIEGSLAGEAFKIGNANIGVPPSSGSGFASRTDKISDYKTDEILSVCLRHRNRKIGVAQFLNRRHGKFDSNDIDVTMDLIPSLAIRVSDLTSDSKRITEIGLAPRRNQHRVSVMFIDLTNYADLFLGMDSAVITDLLNQYFQELCMYPLDNGAIIDQYTGDGVMFIFNIDQNNSDHELSALNAAGKMKGAFANLRQRWTSLGYQGSDRLFLRIGLSSGWVTRAEIGHAQNRRLTVIGPSVNDAAHACKDAPRTHDVICLTGEFNKAIQSVSEFQTKSLATERGDIFELVPRGN